MAISEDIESPFWTNHSPDLGARISDDAAPEAIEDGSFETFVASMKAHNQRAYRMNRFSTVPENASTLCLAAEVTNSTEVLRDPGHQPALGEDWWEHPRVAPPVSGKRPPEFLGSDWAARSPRTALVSPALHARKISYSDSAVRAKNKAYHKNELELKELHDRIEEWKGLDPNYFGDLIHFGDLNVTRDDEGEQELKVYAFETILLCCRSIMPTKTKHKLWRAKSPGIEAITHAPRLQLKGRLHLNDVTNVYYKGPNSGYSLVLCWKGDPGKESLQLHFGSTFETSETRDIWGEYVSGQRDWLIACDQQLELDKSAAWSSGADDARPNLPELDGLEITKAQFLTNTRHSPSGAGFAPEIRDFLAGRT